MFREVYWGIYKSKRFAILKLVLHAICVGLYWIVTIYFLSLWSFHSVLNRLFLLFALCIALFLTYHLVFQGKIYACRREKHQKLYVGETEAYSEMLFYGNEFLYFSAVSESKDIVPYRDIVLLRETKHYYIIITKNNCVYTFDKNGFDTGTVEQAVQLLTLK